MGEKNTDIWRQLYLQKQLKSTSKRTPAFVKCLPEDTQGRQRTYCLLQLTPEDRAPVPHLRGG